MEVFGLVSSERSGREVGLEDRGDVAKMQKMERFRQDLQEQASSTSGDAHGADQVRSVSSSFDGVGGQEEGTIAHEVSQHALDALVCDIAQISGERLSQTDSGSDLPMEEEKPGRASSLCLSETSSVHGEPDESPKPTETAPVRCGPWQRNEDDELRQSFSWKTLPSALSIEKPVSKQRRLVVFLDYDGTLTPIVKDPSTATLSSTMREAVRRLATRAPVAVVSGRAREKIHQFVALSELYYCSSHGFEIDGPGGLRHAVSSDVLPLLSATQLALSERLKGIDGVSLEDNRFAISVHWRNVDNLEARTRVEKIVDEVLALPQYVGALRKSHGKCVYELRPNVQWDKGEAVLYMLELLRRTSKNTVDIDDAVAKRDWYDSILPVYIGDDTTDEDAFGALKPLGGVCVLNVAHTDEGQRPQFTKATHVLRGVHDVETFLNILADC